MGARLGDDLGARQIQTCVRPREKQSPQLVCVKAYSSPNLATARNELIRPMVDNVGGMTGLRHGRKLGFVHNPDIQYESQHIEGEPADGSGHGSREPPGADKDGCVLARSTKRHRDRLKLAEANQVVLMPKLSL
jgi:hypothetical protein